MTAGDADLSVAIGAVTLANPVLPASGTFSLSYGRVFDLACLGALVPKTVMPEPRRGHPPPRLAETAGGLINAVGIPTPGIDAFVAGLPDWLAHGVPVVPSVSAPDAAGFAALCRRLSETGVAAVELNLSCPNLEAGGRSFASDSDAAARVVAACRTATPLPLWAKLSPNATAPADVARAVEAAGADALIVGNTLTGLVLKRDGSPALSNRTGGLSGAPLKPVNLRVADEIARATALPVIGCGGIAGLADALDYFAVGCTAVAVGSANFSRPQTMPRLIADLAAHCAARGMPARDLSRSRLASGGALG